MDVRRQASTPPVIPGYEYTRVLGLGGFADVFLYQQLLPRRPVAVKVLLASSLDEESRRRFQSEANVMAQLSHHPSIVTIYQADIAADGRPYLVMEYCSRPSLGERYRTERISVGEALRIGIRLASAVETAHRAGILHRDIKPANVLTTDFGWPALSDFGIAETIGLAQGSSIGMSIPWSPPELLSDTPTGDARADVYSLAATIYSLLARRSPFEVPDGANSSADLVSRIERSPLPPTGRGDVPDSLQAVLARALDKDPAQRYPSAVAVARALVEVEAELRLPQTAIDVEDGTSSPGSTVPDALPRQGNREADQATRVRPVTTIDPAPAGNATHVRPVVYAQPDSPYGRSEPVIVPQPLPAGPHRRRAGAVTGLAGAVVVAGALVAISIAVLGSRGDHGGTPGVGSSQPASVVAEQVPTPTGLTGLRSADGGVVFTWSNPDPRPGDQYLWGIRTATSEPDLGLLSTPTVTIPAADLPVVAGGTSAGTVCIEVSVVRTDRRASALPAQGCA